MGHLYYYCTTCGLTLTNPVSQSLGQGPICRVGAKNRTMNTPNLFAPRASYKWGFIRPHKPKFNISIIWIEDLDAGKSVTNDMNNVLEEIDAELKVLRNTDSIDNYLLMYRDTMGIWDGINLPAWSGIGKRRYFLPTIFSLRHTRDREEAAERLWENNLRGAPPQEVTEE